MLVCVVYFVLCIAEDFLCVCVTVKIYFCACLCSCLYNFISISVFVLMSAPVFDNITHPMVQIVNTSKYPQMLFLQTWSTVHHNLMKFICIYTIRWYSYPACAFAQSRWLCGRSRADDCVFVRKCICILKYMLKT